MKTIEWKVNWWPSLVCLPARRVWEVSLAEDDTLERNVELDVDLHAVFGALYFHFGDLRHVHHCRILRPRALIKALASLIFIQQVITEMHFLYLEVMRLLS